jgi:putative ABC transport system permease protein
VSGAFTGGTAATTVRRVLVGAQIAITLVLVTGAGLLVKTFVDAVRRGTGYDLRPTVSGLFHPKSGKFASPAEQLTVARDIVGRLRGLPGVEEAAVYFNSLDPPATGITRRADGTFVPAGIAPAAPSQLVSAARFRTLGIRLINGHAFTEADDAGGAPVAILDSATAQRIFPRGDALGQEIKFGGPSASAPWITIVGIVATTNGYPLATYPYRPVMYRPLAQGIAYPGFVAFVTRAAGETDPLVSGIRTALRPLESIGIPDQVQTGKAWEDGVLRPLRVNAAILGAFGGFALLLAALGIYGLLAYLVTQRTAEIGIRMALGATAGDVRRLVLGSMMAMTVVGIAFGAGATVAVTRVLRSMLYGTSPTDPRVFIGAALLLSTTALVAGWLPARRATRMDPVQALRVE